MEVAADALDADDARAPVVLTLEELHVHLLEHLDYEEREAGPATRLG